MATYYVESGAGGGGTGSEGNPFTAEEACDAVNNGDLVWVKADGDYTTEYTTGGAKDCIFYLNDDASATSRITFRGYHTSINDGGIVTLDAAAALTSCIAAGAGDYYTFENFSFNGDLGGINGSNMKGLMLVNCTFDATGASAMFNMPDHLVMIACRVKDCGSGLNGSGDFAKLIGCIIYGTTANWGAIVGIGSLFAFCALWDNSLGNINVGAMGVDTITILNCTLDGENAVLGISMGTTNNEFAPLIINSIIYDCTNGIALGTDYSAGGAPFGWNLYNSNTTDVVNMPATRPGDGVGDRGDIEGTPNFADEAADDYRLAGGSAAIGKMLDAGFTTQFWNSFDAANNPPVAPS